MVRKYLERSKSHEIWIEDGIIVDNNKLPEVTEEHAKETFDIIEKQFMKMKGKRKLVLMIVPNIMSMTAEKEEAKSRLVKIGVDKLALLTKNSVVAYMVVDFYLRITSLEGLNIKIFKSKEKAKEWLLKS